MPKLNITLATGRYDRVMPFSLGEVVPEGVTVNHLMMPVEDVFWRMVRHHEFDVAEMSLGHHVTLCGSGNSAFVAIPVFPSRFFRHSCVFIHLRSGVSSFEDLRGKAVGIPEYSMTAIVWLKGILQHEHGVHPTEVVWKQGGVNEPGRIEKVAFNYPPDARVEKIPPGETLSHLLELGEIAALFCARSPDCFLAGSPQVGRLFPDYRQVEEAYYRRTGIFPIMHTIVIRRPLYEQNPWLARALYRAFSEARRLTLKRLYDTSALAVMLPWLIDEIERERAFFGEEFWPFGLEKNRKVLETFLQYAHEQGLTPKLLAPEELFAPETLDETII
ncbi:MAG: ABC transporter substrate-binding protein [Acidobacteria bacterium]|nr:ABC transporter substrate-binding protein [Acidobacteriota bacterium]